MRIKHYLINNVQLFVLHVLCMIGAALYLSMIDVDKLSIGLILFVWIMILMIWFLCSYWKQKKHFIYLQSVIDNLEKKYLITQVIDRPDGLNEQFYFDLLRQAEKSMMEEITSIRHAHDDYREYVEQWIHEIKGPITSLKLKCENDKSGVLQPVMFEMGQIENYVEQALFFARSENMDKDCLIRPVAICDVVNAAVIKNKHLLLNTVDLYIQPMTETVYSDSKWLEFMIGQIIINSVKYRNEVNSFLKIYTEPRNKDILLKIEDNGMGILPSELPRIFDKGFTGTNGRNKKQSTGLGLYLCKQLCERLEHEITATSAHGNSTIITIRFLST